MGIHLNLAAILYEAAIRHGLRGLVCMLGEQTIAFNADDLARVLKERAQDSVSAGARAGTRLTAQDFFLQLGFRGAESLDVSGYEGATHIFDLNDEELPVTLQGRFDLVLNGGTLEHVFHLPNALTNVTRMLRADGVVVHVLPCNNWVDHGFYQFSPTLMFDYYREAGFQVLESILTSYAPTRDRHWYVEAALPGTLGSGLAGTLDSRIYLHVFMARRSGLVTERPVPTQGHYAQALGITSVTRVRWFEPYLLIDGEKHGLEPARRVTLTHEFTWHGDYCWSVAMPEFASIADNVENPARSPLVLLEDGQVLGPPHTLHQRIREIGFGAYSHWGDALYFSTSDNSAPNKNGRSYVAILPQRRTEERVSHPTSEFQGS